MSKTIKAAITVQALCKYYPVLKTPRERFGYLLSTALGTTERFLQKATVVKSLEGVSFQVNQGERIGIVGRNGAGKTTLLRILNNSLELTSGVAEANGAIYNLSSGQVGLDKYLSGRENAKAYLMQYGLSSAEIENAVEEIQNFVELGLYFDQPIQQYSLGMQMRIEFATATAIKADIITIDEMLGSGDPYWVEKCASRLQTLCDQGSTFLIVSHSLDQIMRYCDRTLWIDNGKLVIDGDTKEVVRRYETFLEQLSWLTDDIDDKSFTLARITSDTAEQPLGHPNCGLNVLRFPGKGGLRFYGIWINEESTKQIVIEKVRSLSFHILLKADTAQQYRLKYLITFWWPNGKRAAVFENEIDCVKLELTEEYSIYAELEGNILAAGEYFISFSLFNLNENQSSEAEKDTRLDMLWKSFNLTVQDGRAKSSQGQRPKRVFSLPAQVSVEST